MQCERCNKKKATVFYRESLNGRVKSLRLCGDCADYLERAGELEDMSIPLLGFRCAPWGTEEGIGNLPFRRICAQPTHGTVKKCPLCGALFGEIAEAGLLGCPNCYTAFSEELNHVIRSTHGPLAHRGRISAGQRARMERTARLESLRRKLADAVAAEEYEAAATLRDEIRRLEAEAGKEA
jgi:protein arginine kinase activator